jgi:glucosamine-6-phosphate deaminase
MYHFYRALLSEVRRIPRLVGVTSGRQVQIGMIPKDDMAEAMAGVRLVHLSNAAEVGHQAALIVAEQLSEKPDSAIIFPTGNTPLPMYEALRNMPEIPWEHSRLFQLDEYIPPAGQAGPPQYETFAAFMDRELWGTIPGQKYYLADYIDNPKAYERLLAENDGPDLVILGIGGNGHIAFNEPGSPPESSIRTVHLANDTVANNFGENALKKHPTQAITLGIRNILQARHILLLATGLKKREILKQALNPAEPPSIGCPASWLKQHPHVTVMTDFEI